ncbi:hypothetical protein [Paragemmobacter straminiformis]|uniref:hypothetical protein n=1 Tax=Paragemmobacter straminiformis TaxID=2045119 RepID=UPI00163A4920|nr:hypothetical protein [Gemmobacter straminiformis]
MSLSLSLLRLSAPFRKYRLTEDDGTLESGRSGSEAVAKASATYDLDVRRDGAGVTAFGLFFVWCSLTIELMKGYAGGLGASASDRSISAH